MTGLEKIIGQIDKESADGAAKIIEAANQEAEKILETAKAQANSECARIAKDSERAAADLLARAKSAADLQRRKTILFEKQRLISEMIQKAKASFDTMGDEEYFGIIIKMVQKFALAGKGEILFSERDLARLPEDFEAMVNSAAKDKGGVLTVSKETRKIDGGFVLVYGGVEENCSFTALFDSEHESLQDKVLKLLFA